MKRYFRTGDRAVDHNLGRLEHFSTSAFERGDAEHIQDWIVGVIGTIKLLPDPIERMFNAPYYMIGDAHFHWDDDVRYSEWKRMADHLAADVAKAAEVVGCDGVPGKSSFDLSKRPVSLGERVESLCTRLMDEGVDTTAGEAMVKELARNQHPQLSPDLRELQRLVKLKRRPHDFRSQLISSLYHMRAVAQELYHCE